MSDVAQAFLPVWILDRFFPSFQAQTANQGAPSLDADSWPVSR